MKFGFLLAAAVAVSLISPSILGGDPGPSVAGWKQKRFLITFWSPPPPTDAALATVAAEHYNLTWVPPEGLDVAARHGLRAMLMSDLLSPASLDDAARRAQLDALIDRVKGHPALEAYFIVDEPGAGAFPGLGKLVAHLKERDPAHFAYTNLFPIYANETQLGITAEESERKKVRPPVHLARVDPKNRTVLSYLGYLKMFVDVVRPDLISYDHYNFFKDKDGEQYFLNLALIRRVALDAGKPFLNIIQVSTMEKAWRLPTASEIRWLVFTTMAYGGRGISYFTYAGPPSYGGLYQDGKATPLAPQVAAINAEIEKFGPALLGLDSLAVYHTAPLSLGTGAIPADAPVRIAAGRFVLGIFGKAGRRTPSAFMVVNLSYKEEAEVQVKVAIPGKALQELDRKTGRWANGPALGADRTVKLKLAPGDGRLLRAAE